MRDLKRYWAEVREMERNLPQFVWLVTLEDEWTGRPGGVMSEAPAEIAAKLLLAKSHRLATDEEITAHKNLETEVVRQEAAEDLRRKGISVVPVARVQEGLKPPRALRLK